MDGAPDLREGAGGGGGEVGDDEVGAGAADGGEGLKDGAVGIEPAALHDAP